jgi:IS5 family transposase
MQTGLKLITGFEPVNEYRVSRIEQKLELINNMVNWEKVILFLKKQIPDDALIANCPVKDLLLKVKILFLQHMYAISDIETEDLVSDRNSFQKFSGLYKSTTILNFNIVWQFREHLKEFKGYEKLIQYILGQLGEKGMVVRKGAITDAAVIDLKSIGNV